MLDSSRPEKRLPFSEPVLESGSGGVRQSFRRPQGSVLRAIFNGVFKDIRRILLSMAAVLAIALISALTAKPSYVASSTLLVLLSSEYSPRAAGDDAKSAAIVLERDAVLKNEVEILTSATLEKETLRRIGVGVVYPDSLKPPGILAQLTKEIGNRVASLFEKFGSHKAQPRVIDPLDLAGAKFAKDLTATPDKAGNIITVNFQNRDPVVAADVLNAQINAYLAKRQELLRDSQTTVLAAQAEALRKELDQAGHDYADFKATNNISDYSTQRQLLLRQQSDTAQDLQQADRDIAQATQRVAVLQQDYDKLPKDTVQYRDIPTVLPRGRPVVLDSMVLDRSRAQQDLQAARARRETDVAQLAKLDDQIRKMDQKEFELQRLDGRRKLIDENFRSVVKALDDRSLQENVMAKKTTNVRVIQEAEAPIAPTNLRLMISVAGVLLSLFAGVATAALSNAFRRGFISPEPLEHSLGLPVLVSVPVLPRAPELVATGNSGRI
jgi:uncharacterized protein involved in exopolysaccharide biosynthesis